MRQDDESDVLSLATNVRDSMINKFDGFLNLNIQKTNGPTSALHSYLDQFDLENLDNVAMICGSNRDVKLRLIKQLERDIGMSNHFLNVGDAIVTKLYMGRSNRKYKV